MRASTRPRREALVVTAAEPASFQQRWVTPMSPCVWIVAPASTPRGREPLRLATVPRVRLASSPPILLQSRLKRVRTAKRVRTRGWLVLHPMTNARNARRVSFRQVLEPPTMCARNVQRASFRGNQALNPTQRASCAPWASIQQVPAQTPNPNANFVRAANTRTSPASLPTATARHAVRAGIQ